MLSGFRWLASLSGVVLLTSACTQADSGWPGALPAEKIPVTVYFQGVLTGRYKYLAIHAFRGAKLRFDELNAEADFPAEVTLERANTHDEWIGERVEAVVGDLNVVAVVGPAFSGESEFSGDTYNAARIPFHHPFGERPRTGGEGLGLLVPHGGNDDDVGAPIGELMAQQFRSIYVAHDTYGFTKGLAEVVAQVASENGADIVAVDGVEPFRRYHDLPRRLYYSALIGDIEDSGAEALFYGGYDTWTGLIVAEAREAGLNIPIWSGEGSLSHVLLDRAGDAATNIVLSCVCNLEGSGDFLARYEAEFGETAVPIFAAEGYDVAGLIGQGIRHAIEGGATNPTAIREGIKEYLDSLTIGRPFQGVAKEIAFDPETHELAAEDRRELIFFYSVEPGAIRLEGSAAELLSGTP